jgi:DNA-binding NtrC family response regulator
MANERILVVDDDTYIRNGCTEFLRSVGYEVCSEIIGEIYRKNLCYKSEPVKAVYTQYSRSKGQPLLNGVNIILGIFMRFVRRV